MKAIATALVKAQSEMSNPKKDSANPFFKSKYADLNSVREAVLPVLNTHGITVLQPIVNVEGKNFVKTIFLHESGESIEGLTEIVYSKQNDAQSQGSGITYARRYGLQSLACVGADDDDGTASSKPKLDNSLFDIILKGLTTKQDFTSVKEFYSLSKDQTGAMMMKYENLFSKKA